MVENAALTEMPSDELLEQRIDRYLDEHWEDIVADIDRLVRIPSFEDLDAAAEGAPYGPGPRKALDAALAMTRDMGFEVHDDAGHVGYADLAGTSEEQLGIIGHIDVVPAGPGWHFEPYQVTRKDGYLLGRGVIDDKGPSVVALHAMNLWRRMQLDGQVPQLPYTLRFIFGVNEETRMDDVHYYRAHHADPAFLFTPDAEFPVCYGEKGIYHSLMTSADVPVEQRTVISLEGGTAVNAVPGHAQAVVRAGACALPPAPGALSTGQCSHHCRKRQLEAHVIDRVPVAQTHEDACRAQRGERIRRASHPDAEGADPDRHRRPEDRGRRAGDAHQQKGRSGPEHRPHPAVSPAPLPLPVGQSIQQAAEDGDVEAAHHQHMGKPRAPVGTAESRSQMAPVAHHHCGQNAAGVFGHAFSQGAAQRRLEPSRPGAEAFAGPKTKHPGQIFRAEDNAVGVVVQTLGGIRPIQRKAAAVAASGLTFGQTGALHPEVDSFPVHFFHH